MKPVNNRIFCIGCRHTKMLFETESKANNFIKFNAPEFNEQGKVPVRSYYCVFCGGWHVTSLEEGERSRANEERDALMMKAVESHRKGSLNLTPVGRDIKTRISKISQALEKCRQELLKGRQSSAKERYDEAGRIFLEIEFMSKQKKIQNPVIGNCRSKLMSYELMFEQLDDPAFDEEAKRNYLQQPSNKNKVLWNFLKVMEAKEAMSRLFSEAKDAKSRYDFELLKNLYLEMKNVLGQKGIEGLSAIRKEFNPKIEQLMKDTPGRISYKKNLSSQDKQLLLSIIATLEEARGFLEIGQSDKCRNLLKTAECLMPGYGTDEEKIIWNQINQLWERL